jgi:secreted Zn-dependent insulinase-like peptidase
MEPFYGIPYLIEDLATAQRPAAVVTKDIADAHIALPQPNRFLCTELIDDTHIRDDNDHDAGTQVNGETVMVEDVRPKRSSPPVPVSIDVTDSGMAKLDRKQVWLWHSRDEVFRQPRSVFFHFMPSRACGEYCAIVAFPCKNIILPPSFPEKPRSFDHVYVNFSCAEDGHPVLSLMSQVFSQVSARKYYQPAVAGLSYSLNIGSRYAYVLEFQG